MLCEKCGLEMPDAAKFCPHCGTPNPNPVSAPEPAPTVSSAPTRPAGPMGGPSPAGGPTPAGGPRPGPVGGPAPVRPAGSVGTAPGKTALSFLDAVSNQMKVTVLSGLQVLLFFLLSYGKLTNIGKVGFAVFDYSVNNVTLWTAMRMMGISGKAAGESGYMALMCLIILLPLVLNLAVLVLNVLDLRKAREIKATPKLSVIFSGVSAAAYLLIRFWMFQLFYVENDLAELGLISILFILIISVAQTVLARRYHAESKAQQG